MSTALLAITLMVLSLFQLATTVLAPLAVAMPGLRVLPQLTQPKGVVLALTRPGQPNPAIDTFRQANFAVIEVDTEILDNWQAQRGLDNAAVAAALASRAAGLAQRFALAQGVRPVLAASGELTRQVLALAAPAPVFHALVTTDLCGAGQISALPFNAPGTPWYAFQAKDPRCRARIKAWTHAFKGLRLTTVKGEPVAAPEFAALLQWMDPTLGIQAGATGLGGLPLVEVPAATPNGGQFAVFLSGDGGWAELDKQVSAELAGRGIPVVGWDSLSYYWTARTPEQAAADLKRIIDAYTERWGAERVLLIGYSFGADTLPFLLARLPPELRKRIDLAVFLGLSPRASFEFHLSSWIDDANKGEFDTAPALADLIGMRLLCVGAKDDEADKCPPLAAPGVSLEFHGDHHFDGDYAGLTSLILQHLEPAKP